MILNYEKSTYYCKHATKIESRINYRTISKYHTRLPSRKSNDLTCFTRALHYTANSRLCIRGSVSNCSSCWEQRSRSRISLFPSKQPLSNSNFSRGRVPPLAATSLRRNSWDWMGRSLGSNQSYSVSDHTRKINVTLSNNFSFKISMHVFERRKGLGLYYSIS